MISRDRRTHVLSARAVLYTLLQDVGFTYYGIAKLTGRDGDHGTAAIRLLVTKRAAEARNNDCFDHAMTCVKDITEKERGVWKLKAPND